MTFFVQSEMGVLSDIYFVLLFVCFIYIYINLYIYSNLFTTFSRTHIFISYSYRKEQTENLKGAFQRKNEISRIL